MNRSDLRHESSRGGPRRLIAALAIVTMCTLAGCLSYDGQSLRKVARLFDFKSKELVEIRKTPSNPLTETLNLLSRSGPEPSERSKQVIRRYDLEQALSDDPNEALARLDQLIAAEPTPDKFYTFAELAFIEAKKAEAKSEEQTALDWYVASVAHAYGYLFDPVLDPARNTYDPQFRQACDIYNSALDGALRIVAARGQLRPGSTHRFNACGRQLSVAVMAHGRWHADEFERFEFVSDYELTGLNNQHLTHGLGVPLIAIRKQHDDEEADEQYYPPGLTFPVTAFLRVLPSQRLPGQGVAPLVQCALELHDPLLTTSIDVDGRATPLESDLSTPLAFYLNDPLLKTEALATFALLNADFAENFKGLYMLEPYDPNKIPVLMVHGLWSSPVTWMEMFNDLRAMPEIRDNYQFWFYLYPTGQPFWLSATQLRHDLAEARQTVDPRGQAESLQHMVLVGHSMGGLVSKLQTIDSGDDFWKIVSDKPFSELQADEETRAQLANALFFQANPSIRRVITLGTPHRGSEFANPTFRWLSRRLFKLPDMFTWTKSKLVRDNPDVFRDPEMLSITTSIDSLAPESPIFPAMWGAHKASWVKYHNIVGRAPEGTWLERIGGKVVGDGDGAVALTSAMIDDAESQIEVPASHTKIHQHPRAVMEVRRILLDHLRDYRQLPSNPWPIQPVGHGARSSPAGRFLDSPQQTNRPHNHSEHLIPPSGFEAFQISD